MRRILICASFAESLVKFRGALIQAALDSGVKVHVVAPGLKSDSEITAELEKKGVVVHDLIMKRTGLNPIVDAVTFVFLFLILLRVRPTIFLAYTIKPVIYGSLAAWLVGVHRRFVLITGLGYAFIGESSGKRGVLRKLLQGLYRFSLARTHKVFFQNPDDEALFRELRLLSDQVPSCIVNGSGVDISEYQVVPLPEQARFLLIGRLLGDKGVREYAQAAFAVKAKYPSACFQMVGWIDDNPDAINQKELDDWVESGTLEFLGKLDDVRPSIANCRVFVLPSYREGTPRTVLEAMAMGRAIITTDAPGCRETVVDGGNGYLVPVQDSEALAHAMLRCIEYPDNVAAMGVVSRQIAENKYDVHKVNQIMLKEMGIL
ncbi:glycosyltransferase family 4 protein [Alloalcanivorax xenomutans]|uniref:glycosyltransferase family 4 protein n=1 Tax=Alloalcanivorax xenomutans TaxID=1094342 RepID=UPI003BAB1ADD